MADNVQQFIKLANFYNQMREVMSAICVNKGGIALENYTGRFFAADVLEFIVTFGDRAQSIEHSEQIKTLVARFEAEFEKVKDLTTPSQKPLHEMTLAEFEKVMNI